jgi:hypothetical protein
MSRTKLMLFPLLCGALAFSNGCAKEDDTASGDGDGDTSTDSGDGDGDGDGDGSGDGDGDGDGDGTGDGDGDGDGDGAGDGDGDGDGATFVPENDGAVSPTCDPFLQDCADGEKCVPYQSVGDTWDSNKCVEVKGNGAEGDSCIYDGKEAGTDDCDAQTLCWMTQIVDGEEIGVCTPFCEGNANNPICDPGLSCGISNGGSINMCVPNCDPLLQDCTEGNGCYWANTQFLCIHETDNIAEGEPCGYINDCAPGNLCASAESLPSCAGASCCTGWCDLGDASCQIAGTECAAFFAEGEAPPGLDHVGVCVIPG